MDTTAPAGPQQQGTAGSTRDRLLAAAVVVGARAGWGGVTTRSVATEAGVRQGVVHYHFRSVDDLRRTAVARVLEDLEHDVGLPPAVGAASTSAGGADPTTPLHEALLRLLAPTPADADATVFVHEAFVAARRDEALREQLAAAVRRFRGTLATWFGEVAPTAGGPDPQAVSALLVAAVDGLYLHRVLGAGVDPATLLPAVMRLLGADAGGTPPLDLDGGPTRDPDGAAP